MVTNKRRSEERPAIRATEKVRRGGPHIECSSAVGSIGRKRPDDHWWINSSSSRAEAETEHSGEDSESCPDGPVRPSTQRDASGELPCAVSCRSNVPSRATATGRAKPQCHRRLVSPSEQREGKRRQARKIAVHPAPAGRGDTDRPAEAHQPAARKVGRLEKVEGRKWRRGHLFCVAVLLLPRGFWPLFSLRRLALDRPRLRKARRQPSPAACAFPTSSSLDECPTSHGPRTSTQYPVATTERLYVPHRVPDPAP